MLLAHFGRLVAGLFVVAATAALAAGQPHKTPPRLAPTVVLYSTLYLGDDGVREELKLTPEQVKRLAPLVLNAFGDVVASWDLAKSRDERSKAQADVHAAVLSDAQRARLRQIILQHLGRVPGGPEVLAADADVVKRLDLTDAQVQDLKARKPLAGVLTEKQKTAWAELCGPAFAKRLVMRGVGGSAYSPLPKELLVLYSDVGATALKITDEQEERFATQRADWLDLFPGESYNLVTKYDAEFVKAAKVILAPEQRVRYEQILLQMKVRNTLNLSVYELPEVAEALALTAEQKTRIAALRRERRAAMLALFLAGDPPAAVREKVAAHDAETPKLLAAAVTAEQQAKLKELLGDPIAPYTLMRMTAHSADVWFREPPPRTGYVAIFALAYASYPAVHDILKLDAGQVQKVAALQKEMNLAPTSTNPWPAGPDDDDKRRAMAAEIEKLLAEILKPEQVKEWKQLAVRNVPLEGRLDAVPYPQLLATREVRDGLKLTPKQLRRFERGATLGEVLDADQQKAWRDLAGTPLPQKPAPPGPVVVFSFNMLADPIFSQLTAVSDENVQKHLGLSDEQKKAIKDEQAKAQGSYDVKSYSPEKEAAIQKRGAELLAIVAKLLDEPQRRRLQQIGLQQAMKFEGPKALRIYAHPTVAAAVKLTPKQVETVKTLLAEYQEVLAMVYAVPQVEFVPTGDDRYQTTLALTNVTEKRVRDVLTADQKTAFKELLGEPYNGIVRPVSRAFLPW